jgi:hypothetical protein
MFPMRYPGRCITCLCLAIGLSTAAHSETRRALLIGIDHYAPPAGATLPVSTAGHSPDSRFASGATWTDLNGPLVDVLSMQVLLKQSFGFQDLRVLDEQQATRQGILAAIDQLVTDTHPGDLVVFYFAGHGSQRLDTLSSKNHLDETIVPTDAWKGTEDIRDKELALRFDKIVYGKHAHLTAIYDSCHSGTMARGITNSVQRFLPYDDRDVADEKKRDPSTVTDLDLKQIPQNGDSVIIAAASSTQSAVEAKYPGDDQFHGAFTRALVRVLQSSTQTLSANDLVAAVSNMLHADPVPFQQPSVEGRTQESLFGEPVAARTLHVHISAVSSTTVTLDMGSAGGFDVGTQFTALEADSDKQKALIEVRSIDEPLVSTAQTVYGTARVGQIFELAKLTYPQTARLVIFVPKPEPAPFAAAATNATLFPNLTWVDDPTIKPIDFLVVDDEQGWVAYDRSGRAVAPGGAAKGTAFLLLGPPPSLKSAIELGVPFQRKAFSFTTKLTEANYLLAARIKPDSSWEYALIDPIVLAAHMPDAYVTSSEDDPDESALNGGVQPEVVCRNDVSLPVRTAWLAGRLESGDDLVLALNRRIVRLGKLRVWLQSSALAPGAAGWPYHLAIMEAGGDNVISGMLHPQQKYDVWLRTTADQRAATIPKYVYLIVFDCAGNPSVLYPPPNLNGEAETPQPGVDGVYPLSLRLLEAEVATPLGADTFFLMATAEKLTNSSLLVSDGVLRHGTRGAANPFDELVTDISDAGTRGPRTVPTNWLIQQLVVPSRP